MREATGNQNKHVILVLDGFGSHCYSWKSLHKMADAKIKVIKMPSHTSSALQPLDVAVFKVLKGEWRAFVDLYQLAMPGEAMSKYDLCKWFQVIWEKIMEGNELARQGMKKSGLCPFNSKWVVENKDKLTISESFTCTEDDLAVLAVAEEYDIQSETVARDIITVRGMLSSPRLQESINTIIDSAEIEQTVTADDVMDLLHRVERYEVSLDLPEDAILAKPWWQEKIKEWLERAGCGDDAVDGACDDGHSQGPSRKKARGPKIHKATGERLSAPWDCTAPSRLAMLAEQLDKEMEAEQEKKAKQLEKEEKKRKREEEAAKKAQDKAKMLEEQHMVVTLLESLGFLPASFNLATSIITKSILSQFIKAQKLNKQEWKSYVTRKQLDSKLGISSKGVTSSMLVTFLKDILEEQPGRQWLAKTITTPIPLETVEAPI